MAGKIGPRVIVQVGKGKNGKAVYSYMLKKIADNFGFTIEKKIPQRKGKNGRIIVQRGSVGRGSITVPLSARAKTPKGNTRTASIPIPEGMTIPKIQAFLQKAKKNKPEYFVSMDGRSWPVN
ncbi:MAG: hypothetical protein F6K58_21850 [Symploca sp. SIO2E9]|nr:hypothetical protein [Symploca sp. SIO2E9]